jgi:hypothetical protein
MTGTQAKSVVDYLRLKDSKVHEEHLTTVRDHYRQALKLSNDDALPEDTNEEVITEVARQLNLRIDTDEARDYLRDCVRYEAINDAITVVSMKLLGEEKPIDEHIFQAVTALPPLTRFTPPVIQDSPRATQSSIVIADIDCLLKVKMQTTEVDQFIHTFLLQDTKLLPQQITTY